MTTSTKSNDGLRRLITAVLRHPVTMAAKGIVRDLAWGRKGRLVKNPPLPRHAGTLLFVCLGNICRSPFAGLLAAERLREVGATGMVSLSAGIKTTQAKRSPRDACDAAATYGLSLEHHVPQPLTPDLMDTSDMVIVMEASQLTYLGHLYPRHRDKIFLMSLFDEKASGAYERYNIADPFGQPATAFEACYQRIDRAVDHLLAVLPRA